MVGSVGVGPLRNAARSRRLIRLRPTAPATLREMVRPKRGGAVEASSAAWATICIVKSDDETRAPFFVARTNSARRRRRSGGGGIRVDPGDASAVTPPPPVCEPVKKSGRKALAATGAARGNDFPTADRRHAGAEAMAALANDLAGLIRPFHRSSPRATRRPFEYNALFCLQKNISAGFRFALPTRADWLVERSGVRVAKRSRKTSKPPPLPGRRRARDIGESCRASQSRAARALYGIFRDAKTFYARFFDALASKNG